MCVSTQYTESARGGEGEKKREKSLEKKKERGESKYFRVVVRARTSSSIKRTRNTGPER